MSEAPKATILVVEDDEDAVEPARILLEDEGYRVIAATSRDDGLEAVRREKPDLVLLDVMMPSGTEGFHFVWELRRDSDAERRDIPIIVLTAIHRSSPLRFCPDRDDGDYQPYEYLPVQGFLDKPASSERILSEVERALKARDASGQRESQDEGRSHR